tara:strand:+ start:1788 stop:2066 length:279 start_codon:yes stop_codon:yes gene_type:complete
MTIKIKNSQKKSNVISLKKYKKNKNGILISSTVAAIIAIKVDHPKNIEPQDYIIDKLEDDDSIQVLAYEDALDSHSEYATNSKSINTFINDA